MIIYFPSAGTPAPVGSTLGVHSAAPVNKGNTANGVRGAVPTEM